MTATLTLEIPHVLRGRRGQSSLPEAALATAAVAVLSGTTPPPSLTDLVLQIGPRPLLLIDAGHGVEGEELNPDYVEAASSPNSIWKIAEAGHVGGLQARPDAYEQWLIGFFDRALLGSG